MLNFNTPISDTKEYSEIKISEVEPILKINLRGKNRDFITKIGKEFYQSADLVISIGSQFEELETQAWKMYPHNAKFLEINIDSLIIL